MYLFSRYALQRIHPGVYAAATITSTPHAWRSNPIVSHQYSSNSHKDHTDQPHVTYYSNDDNGSENSTQDSTSSSSVTSDKSRRRRRRHKFDLDLEKVPSFQEFQQQQSVRALYRDYMRLVWPLSQKQELIRQIRTEFKVTASASLPKQSSSSTTSTSLDPWEVKRRISEGRRRIKELEAMLGNVVDAKKTTTTTSTTNTPPRVAWPWQRPTTSSFATRHMPSKTKQNDDNH